MVRALDGDSTMTSLVPWPLPVEVAAVFALAPLPLFAPLRGLAALVLVFAALLAPLAPLAVLVVLVVVLAGTFFPSSPPRRDRLTVPVITRGPEAATIGPVWCVPVRSPQ